MNSADVAAVAIAMLVPLGIAVRLAGIRSRGEPITRTTVGELLGAGAIGLVAILATRNSAGPLLFPIVAGGLGLLLLLFTPADQSRTPLVRFVGVTALVLGIATISWLILGSVLAPH